MAKTILFRCKTPNGPCQISNLTDQDKILDLKTALINLTGIKRLKVLNGYPPRELDLNHESTQLGGVFKTQKELLIVSENVSPNMKGQSLSPSTESINRISPTRISSNGFAGSGRLLRKVVPANNSCLFTAVYFCITNGVFNPQIGNELRKIIVKKVMSDPIQFNDAILGCPSKEYCQKIMNENVWGGSIELAILSEHYSVEIVAVDTQNVRLNRFGEDKRYSQMIMVIYDGIHYDALYFEKSDQPNKPITIFPANSNDSAELLTLALSIASEAKSKRQFTDVKNFKLKCLACSTNFTGSEQANLHAKQTGHTNFGEF